MPSQALLRQRARSRHVESHEEPEEAKMFGSLLRGFRYDRHLQAAADCLGDLSQCLSFGSGFLSDRLTASRYMLLITGELVLHDGEG